jgi:thiosulfate reductase / polysulfide reductase chain A
MVSRRDFLRLGAASATTVALGSVALKPARAAEKWKMGGVGYSSMSGFKHRAIPTTCAQCPSRCPTLGYVTQRRVVKIEGNPDSIRTFGRVCAKGQAGIDHINDPDRILYPLKRVGGRGEGKWKRISWDEALGELAGRLKKLRDEGHPEKFYFQHGWISDCAEKLVKDVFLAIYGTGTIASNTCLGQGAKYTGLELTWGGAYDNWDIANTNFVLNFGSNFLEAHTNHVALASRLAYAMVDRNLEMVTFDVRLSNTAAKSRQWLTVKPGTDLAVVLAMCNVVMSKDLYVGQGEEFLKFCKVTPNPDASTADKIAALKAHLKPYTPEWAEKVSGVSAERIVSIATELTVKKPAAIISSRGSAAHHNGVDTERAIQMLAAITGNIDNPGGRCQGIAPVWTAPSGPKKKPKPKSLNILNGFEGQVALPNHGVGHQTLKMIKDGAQGRPEVYLWYNVNPVYSNGEVQENIDVLKDESLIPYSVCVSPFYDESAVLADLILPDAVYLERYDFENPISPSQVPEFALRQPLAKPVGEARDFKDVCCTLAEKMGMPLGFKNAQAFVKATLKRTKSFKKSRLSLKRFGRKGIWHDKDAKPTFYAYRQEIPKGALEKDGVIFDQATGVYWNWRLAGAKDEAAASAAGYAATPDAYKGYVGQKVGDAVYAGFMPHLLNKSGFFELYSDILKAKGRDALPTYEQVPEHKDMTDKQLILTTFKINVQTLSRTQNCRWLTEIVHDNPAWINTATAAALGIGDGQVIKVTSSVGAMDMVAKVTEVVAPGILAVSQHCGRWAYGRYASNEKAPLSVGFDDPSEPLKWWDKGGVHPNWIVPNAPEPVSGQQRWMDTVVTVEKA